MVTLGTRTSTIIRMPGIHIHTIPPPQAIGTVGIGLTTVIIATLITKVIEIMLPRGLVRGAAQSSGP
jgi:hypothetical protein